MEYDVRNEIDPREIVRAQSDGVFSPEIVAFLCAAQTGSFNGATKWLHMSRPAVIKQVNKLESMLHVSLFDRSARGLELTEAGKVFCGEMAYQLKEFNKAVALTRALAPEDTSLIRIGVSQMTPGRQLEEMLPDIEHDLPDLRFEFVPFINGTENARLILSSFGEEIDVVIGAGVDDKTFLTSYGCSGLTLVREPLAIGVPLTHRLAGVEKIRLSDLAGERLYCVRPGWNHYIDAARADIIAHYPDIEIVNFYTYDAAVFNTCCREGALVTTTYEWREAHPLLTATPVEWGHVVPLGLLYAADPAPHVQRLVDYAREVVHKRLLADNVN